MGSVVTVRDAQLECRICRSSAEELLLRTRRAQRGTTDRRTRLYRVKCACTGSLEHLCGSCYRRYYLQQRLDRCEICLMPIGIEHLSSDSEPTAGRGCLPTCVLSCRLCLQEGEDSDVEDADDDATASGGDDGLEGRFLLYACFVLVVFVIVVVLFFAVSAKLRSHSTVTSRQARPQQRRQQTTDTLPAALEAGSVRGDVTWLDGSAEAAVFASVACVNLAIALAYMAYSYRRRCHHRGCRCCRRLRQRSRRHVSRGHVADSLEEAAAPMQDGIISGIGDGALPNVVAV